MITFPSRHAPTLDGSMTQSIEADKEQNDPLSVGVLSQQFQTTERERRDFLSLPAKYKRRQPSVWELEAINVRIENLLWFLKMK